MKENPSDKTGIYLDPDFCRDKVLTPAHKIILGNIRQSSKSKTMRLKISNKTLAQRCGLSTSTVTTGIRVLQEHGWISLETSGGPIRYIIPQYRPNRNCEAPLTVTDASASQMRSTDEVLNVSVTPELQPYYDIYREWMTQVLRMMRPYKKEVIADNGWKQKINVKTPVPGFASDADIQRIKDLAQEFWSGCDPLLGFRQVLRAAAYTRELRNQLQEHCCLRRSKPLSLGIILDMGAPNEPLSFIRNCMASVPPPPPAVEHGSADAGKSIARYAHVGKVRWSHETWSSCWREAAGRCKELGRPEMICMAFAAYQAEASKYQMPLPWLAGSVTASGYESFMELYRQDRLNAWTGGATRTPPSPGEIEFGYGSCVGYDVAKSAAAGETNFSNRSCLLCAALDLRLTEALVSTIPDWKGTVHELAEKLEELAADTVKDELPQRNEACGLHGCSMPSLIRCPFGLATAGTQETGIREDRQVETPSE